ncbi:hypothetical protein [Bacillus toyonensis]|uniref:hypothetical protein n=1 Tax=Bacillus toyonensis TaxID=155322 RepID=UPI002E2081EA|nr:hypothetical protein [Bacillus toyonensis]
MIRFIKENKLILFLSSAVFIVLIVLAVSLVSYFTNNEKVKDVTVYNKPGKNEEKGEPLHKDYIPDIKEPFDEDKKSYAVSDLVFSKPKEHKNVTVAGTGATLTAGGTNNILIHAYGGYLYTNYLPSNETFTVEKFTEHSNMDSTGRYIFFSEYVDPVKKEEQTLRVFTKDEYVRKEVGKLEKGLKINNSVYFKGMFLYSASDLAGTKLKADVVISDTSVSQAEFDKLKGILNSHQFTLFKVYKDHLFGFDKKTQSIYELTGGNLTLKAKVPTQYLINFAPSENNMVVIYNDLKNVYYTINGKESKELQDATYPIWFDENQLLFLKQFNLHIYNMKNQELKPVFSGASSLYVDKNRIYMQEQNSNSIKTIDILNR